MEKKIKAIKFDSEDLASLRLRNKDLARSFSAAEQARAIKDQVAAASQTIEGSRAFRQVAMLTGK